jgi:hypothetical protein
LPEGNDDWHRLFARERQHARHALAPVRCKTRSECRTILLMKVTFPAAATAAVFALVLACGAHAQGQPTDTSTTVKNDARSAGHAVAHSATAVGHTVADKSRQAGHAIAEDTRSARDTIRDDSKKVGHSVADGARSVGRSFKDGAGKVKASFTGKSSDPAPRS